VTEHAYEPIRGLPGLLPPGERLIWQGAPDWLTLARRTFLGDIVAIYFLVLMAWRLTEGLVEGSGIVDGVIWALWLAPVAIAALAVIAALGWATARSTVYTITSRRVVMRIGVALSITINVPFKRVVSANLKPLPGGHGDIALRVGGADKFAYLALWPHARPWRFGNPEPMMRAVPNAATVARELAERLATYQAANGIAPSALETSTSRAPAPRPAAVPAE
jgi:hypothetical protein